MTPGFVADSSLALAWVVESQSSGATEELLDKANWGEPVLVPALWMIEVANALLTLFRRRRIEKREYDQARIDLADLHAVVDDEGHHLALGTISELAARHGLSVYDAVYLELALRRELPLATRDSALNKAAKSAGVPTLL